MPKKNLSKTNVLSSIQAEVAKKGLSIKDVRTKSLKIEPSPLVRKMSALNPPLSVRHHKFRKFFRPKVRTSASEEPSSPLVRTGQIPLTADVFYGRPLTYCVILKMFGD